MDIISNPSTPVSLWCLMDNQSEMGVTVMTLVTSIYVGMKQVLPLDQYTRMKYTTYTLFKLKGCTH